ncbi:MAG TPA: ATP-binding protein, partial [Candidatus Ozemobacteraceae bacterium]|nr:ATP-binding protein [Candidatus Ozemobacteraceae bacterium]
MAKLCCKNGDSRKAVERLGAALDVFSRAKDLTRQLLTFAKGGKPVQKTMSIEPILRRSSTFMLSGSNVSCDMRLQEGLWLCHIDENQIAQAVDNIILNARQAMPKGGQITITAENVPAGSPGLPGVDLGDTVRVSIRDTGPGIDPKARARIFDPFFTTKSAGSGLGLSIVFSIMKRHGGFVDLESQPGEGAAFILYLPRAQSDRKASGKRQAVVDMKSPLGGGRILVMDDEPFMRDICRELLEDGGFAVTCAANGDEAIDLFRSDHQKGVTYIAAILDLTVPGGKGGIEALAELRAIDPDICAIASSGYSNDPVMAQPAKYGFARCLPKPFKMEELFAAIRCCAALRPS